MREKYYTWNDVYVFASDCHHVVSLVSYLWTWYAIHSETPERYCQVYTWYIKIRLHSTYNLGYIWQENFTKCVQHWVSSQSHTAACHGLAMYSHGLNCCLHGSKDWNNWWNKVGWSRNFRRKNWKICVNSIWKAIWCPNLGKDNIVCVLLARHGWKHHAFKVIYSWTVGPWRQRALCMS